MHTYSGGLFDIRHNDRDAKRGPSGLNLNSGDALRRGGGGRLSPEEHTGDWEHPLVRVHPITKQRALYMKLEATKEMPGLGDQEARKLLRSLRDHTEAGGIYSHAWRLHDVLIWDDLRVMHRGQNDFPVGEPRLHHRFLLRTMRTPEDENAEVRIRGSAWAAGAAA